MSGHMQAGVIASLVESAAADAALARTAPGRGVSLVDLHISQFRAGASGPMTATAQATGGGRSLCFCEVRVDDALGLACAQAMVTLRYRDPD